MTVLTQQQLIHDDVLHQEYEWRVIRDDSMDYMAVRVCSAEHQLFISFETWHTLCLDADAVELFMLDFTAPGGGDGMKFIVADAGPFAAAQRARADSDPVRAKDRLTEFEEQTTRLIIQVASLNTAATQGQSEIFAVRYARLREGFDAITQDVDRIRGLLELAAVALFEA